MLGPSLRMKKNLGCLWVQIYTSTLAWFGRLGTNIPFYASNGQARGTVWKSL